MIGETKRGTITAIVNYSQQVDIEDGGRYFLQSIFDAVPGGKVGDRVILTFTQVSTSMCLWVGRKASHVDAAREKARKDVYNARYTEAQEAGFGPSDCALHAEQAVTLFDKERP